MTGEGRGKRERGKKRESYSEEGRAKGEGRRGEMGKVSRVLGVCVSDGKVWEGREEGDGKSKASFVSMHKEGEGIGREGKGRWEGMGR